MATKDRTSLKNDFANGKYATGEKFADLIDSMKVVQLPVVDPQALGTSLSFIDSISQDADGKITATKKTLDLANAHELNPFKGWYKTGDTLPTDGFDGAYLYFKDTTQTPNVTTIYQWNGTTYVDTETEVDESNVNTFGSGQQVNAVKIKDEAGEEVQVPADVLSAEAGKALGEEILGTIETQNEEIDLATAPQYKISLDKTSLVVWDTYTVAYRSYKIALDREDVTDRKLIITSQTNQGAYFFIAKEEIPIANTGTIAGTTVNNTYAATCNSPQSGSDYRMIVSSNSSKEILLSNDAKFLYIQNYYSDADVHPESVVLQYTAREGGLKKDVEEISGDVSTLTETVNANKTEIDEEISNLTDSIFGELQEVEVEAEKPVRVGNMDSSTFYASSGKLYEIDLTGYTKLKLVAQEDKGIFFTITKQKLPTTNVDGTTIKNEYLADIELPVQSTSNYRCRVLSSNSTSTETPKGEWTADLDESCKYLYVTKEFSTASLGDYTPANIILTKEERVGGIVDEIGGNDSSNGIRLNLQEDGSILTSPLPLTHGVVLSVNEPYRVQRGILVDMLNHNVINEYVVNRTDTLPNKVVRTFSWMAMTAPYEMVFRIVKMDGNTIVPIDGSSITSIDDVIQEFALVDTFNRVIPDNPAYRAFKKKLQTSIGVVWKPLRKVPYNSENNPRYYNAGNTYIGIPYTGPTQWRKHVGIEVSVRTFMTALQNPRSVMYTERIGSANPTTSPIVSKYGYTHNSYSSEAGAYYGCVCTGLTSYLLGRNDIVTSSNWNNSSSFASQFDKIMGGEVSASPTIVCSGETYSYEDRDAWKTLAALIQPMDFVWNSGHCAVVSDVYVDNYGEVKYIVIAEQTVPTSMARAFTPEYLFSGRFKNNIENNKAWAILRKRVPLTVEEASIPRKGQDAEFVLLDNSMFTSEESYAIDNDISTFAGEYAMFKIGDYSDSVNDYKMFLNIHRGGTDGYTHLQIFNEGDDEASDTPLAEIDITSYSTDTNLGDNGYILPTDQEEDWIIYNLAQYWNTNLANTTGKFKARVVRKESGTITLSSGCTHFGMVKMELTVSSGTFSFVVKGGEPVMYRNDWANGLPKYAQGIPITENDYTYSDGVYTGTISFTYTTDYLQLYVKTDYGMSAIRVNLEA